MINNVALKPVRVIVETTNDSFCIDAYVIYEDGAETLALRIDRVEERVLHEELARSVDLSGDTSSLLYVVNHSAAYFGEDYELWCSAPASPEHFRYASRGMRLEHMLMKAGLKNQYNNGIILFENWRTPEQRDEAVTLLKLQHGGV